MTKSTLIMLKADDGMVLEKDGLIVKSVLLKEGESEDGWNEIPEPEPPTPPVQ